MNALRCGSRLGLGLLAAVVWAAGAAGAEPVEGLTGTVTDEQGGPLEGVTARMCGVEKLRDGRWHRNRRPDCLLPSPSKSDRAGRFTVPIQAFFDMPPDEEDTRLNFWFDKPGFAPTYVAGISLQPRDFSVIVKRGIRVSGTVRRLREGRLEPVQRAAVYLQCSSGDLAHQKRVFEDPYFFLLEMGDSHRGCDLPYRHRVLTDADGRYTVVLSPPPADKKWYLVCADQWERLDVNEGQPVRGPDFLMEVLAR